MMENHVLPDLPYDYAALEPYISGEIMELHHDKHHDTYVKGINTAVEQLAEARAVESFGSLSTLEKNLAFHLGGHVNHSVFWSQVAGRGDKPPATWRPRATSSSARSTSPCPFRGQRTRCTGLRLVGADLDMLAQRLFIVRLFDHQSVWSRCSCSTCGSTPTTCSTRTTKPAFVKQWWYVLDSSERRNSGLLVRRL